MTAANTLREIVRVATSELQDLERKPQHRGEAKALDVAAQIFPAATLYASQAVSGMWHYYLVMPTGWEPPEGSGHWTHCYERGYYWYSGVAVPWDPIHRRFLKPHDPENTERGALLAGLRKLLDAL